VPLTPDSSARILEAALVSPPAKLTVADAAAASGLSLAEAERGLHALVAEYRGHLEATESGELLFGFPHGFSKPWQRQEGLARFFASVGRVVGGAARFVVRAWVAIVLVGYVAIFVAIMIGLFFARSSSSEDRGGSRGGGLLPYFLFRLVADALFFSYHPLWRTGEERPRRWFDSKPSRRDEGPPFYERVDRFFFGPPAQVVDPEASKKAVLAEIRAKKGRIGLADVMRVTGLSRAEVDPLLSRLLVDYDGEVEVSDEGGIFYRFPDLRKTADARTHSSGAKPVWERREELPPVTGNTTGSNLLIGGLNAFNLFASIYVVANGLTFERMWAMFQGVPAIDLPPPGVPLALGLVPLVFSLLLFLLPLGRMLLRPLRKRRVDRENGRRAVLQAVLEAAPAGGVAEAEIVRRYRIASGSDPDPTTLRRELVALGGDIDLESDVSEVRYRFRDLELEARAVEAEREAAADHESQVGKVVFSSAD
jgi:hypothetical protein